MRKPRKGITIAGVFAVLVLIIVAASIGYFYETTSFSGSQESVQSSSSTHPPEWRTFSTRTFHVGCCPGYVAFDQKTGILYVTVQPENAVYAVDPTTGAIIANISVGSYPRDVVVNPYNGMVYVVNQGSDSVSVIDGTTNRVVSTVPVGRNPVEIAVNTKTGLVYVPDELSHELTVINGSTNLVIAEVTLGCSGPCTNSTTGVPNSVDVDPDTGIVYVVSNGVDSIQLVNGSSNQVVETVRVGTYPDGVAVDPQSGTAYVANMLNNSVSVVDPLTGTVVETLNVGVHPGDVAYDQTMGDIFVANEGNNSISVIGATTNALLSNIRVGAAGENPSGITVDSASGDVYAAVPSSGNVTVIAECNSSICHSISGSTPSCGSYDVVWPYPNTSPVLPGSPVTSSITTCTKGTGSWSIMSKPSNALVAAGAFTCPCSDTLLFNYTAGVPPLTNGTYWLQESFNGGGFGVTFVVPSAH